MTEGRVLVDGELALEWHAEHQKVSGLAGLFRGWVANDFGSDRSPRILYVGQATSGNFDEADVHATAFDGRYHFWAFARKIADTLDRSVSQCIAWSNISKLAAATVSPDSRLISSLNDLAERTLEQEITATEPDVIVFVCGHFSDAVVNAIAGTNDDMYWSKSEEETSGAITDVWWLDRSDGRRVLWMCHPRAASLEKQKYAANKIAELTYPLPAEYKVIN